MLEAAPVVQREVLGASAMLIPAMVLRRSSNLSSHPSYVSWPFARLYQHSYSWEPIRPVAVDSHDPSSTVAPHSWGSGSRAGKMVG